MANVIVALGGFAILAIVVGVWREISEPDYYGGWASWGALWKASVGIFLLLTIAVGLYLCISGIFDVWFVR